MWFRRYFLKRKIGFEIMSDMDGEYAFDRLLDKLLDAHTDASKARTDLAECVANNRKLASELSAANSELGFLKNSPKTLSPRQHEIAKQLAEAVQESLPFMPNLTQEKLETILKKCAESSIYDPEA